MIEKCNLCGLCKSACPIYKATKKETYSPRGQIILIKENIITDTLTKCLNCNLCQQACPSKIDIAKIIRNARALLVNSLEKTKEEKQLVKNLRESGNIYGI